jgi:hypothetical protein
LPRSWRRPAVGFFPGGQPQLKRRAPPAVVAGLAKPARFEQCTEVPTTTCHCGAMQSTGQGGRHSSQPEQSAAMTVCIHLRAPTIASVGQASMHFAQPMHAASSIRATRGGASVPQPGSSGSSGTPSNPASAAMTCRPPGGQRLMAVSPRASACA